MSSQFVLVAVKEGFGIFSINNPPVHALSQQVLSQLNNLFDEFKSNDSVRAIILTSTGEKIFSAGADITEFDLKTTEEEELVDGNDLFLKIEQFPKPVIAAIHANAYGGGTELALCCHLRIMAATAELSFPEIKLGIIPGWGGTQRLPRLIGKPRAIEMMLTGKPLTSKDASICGLVNKVVPKELVLSEAEKLAAELAQNAPLGMQEILHAVIEGSEQPIEQGIKIEQKGFEITFESEDAQEGAIAFKEKRHPRFKGL